MPSIDRHGQRSVSGDVVVEMRPADYDWLLEGALFGTFASDILNTGTTVKSYSIQDAALDITQFRTFEGVMVNAQDDALRRNRLALLTGLHRLMNRVADLSKLAA
jgi:glycyl-tRNA synthetase beta subunit